jgi:hypothetical protein
VVTFSCTDGPHQIYLPFSCVSQEMRMGTTSTHSSSRNKHTCLCFFLKAYMVGCTILDSTILLSSTNSRRWNMSWTFSMWHTMSSWY